MSSSDEVYDVSISWIYILLSLTDNFGVGKWAKLWPSKGFQGIRWTHGHGTLTRSHTKGVTRLPWRYVHKNNWFWKVCCGNIWLTRYTFLFACFLFHALSSFFLGVRKVCNLLNMGENEDLRSYSKVIMKKETSTANHGSFPKDFHD